MTYFDYAASCPLDADAAEIYVKAATEFYGNSQSLHDTGSAAASLLESCRNEFASLLGVDRAGIFFTSGGSEANLLGIMGLLSAVQKPGRHIVTGAAEHSSVFHVMKKLEKEGWKVTYLPLNKEGQIDIDQLRAAVRNDTVLLSIQYGNPEIGTIQRIEEIGSFSRGERILFHSDFVQTFGKINCAEAARSVDALSLSGHKFYGPKGTGAAYLNPRLAWKPFIPGTTHEKGFRPGTVNVPGIAAMAAAAGKIHETLPAEWERQRALRKKLIETVGTLTDKLTVFGKADTEQLPGIIGMAIKGVEGQFVLLEANRSGFSLSTGTACHVGMESPAKSMIAMGIEGKQAKEFFRVSFGLRTTEEDVSRFGSFLGRLANELAAD